MQSTADLGFGIHLHCSDREVAVRWPGIMDNIPTFKFAFVFFMVTSSWTLLSILTAVATRRILERFRPLELERIYCTLYTSVGMTASGCHAVSSRFSSASLRQWESNLGLLLYFNPETVTVYRCNQYWRVAPCCTLLYLRTSCNKPADC